MRVANPTSVGSLKILMFDSIDMSIVHDTFPVGQDYIAGGLFSHQSQAACPTNLSTRAGGVKRSGDRWSDSFTRDDRRAVAAGISADRDQQDQRGYNQEEHNTAPPPPPVWSVVITHDGA
jgi:hypothetical protein